MLTNESQRASLVALGWTYHDDTLPEQRKWWKASMFDLVYCYATVRPSEEGWQGFGDVRLLAEFASLLGLTDKRGYVQVPVDIARLTLSSLDVLSKGKVSSGYMTSALCDLQRYLRVVLPRDEKNGGSST